MKGDFTRDTLRLEEHFRTVRFQQGRVPMDAELNEGQDILMTRVEHQAEDVIGPDGAPVNDAGFGIKVSVGGDILIGAGRYYVGGVLCELDEQVAVDAQPALPGFELPDADGVYLAYLDVWFGHVTAVEDPYLREVALLGADTTTRQRVLPQVRLLQVSDDPAAEVDCRDDFPEWNELTAAPTGMLRAQAEPEQAPPDACTLTPGAGYRRLENQLYRVEIHDPGDAGEANFKWSRENGSIVTRWLAKDGDDLKIGTQTRDPQRAFAPGDWVELIDLERELSGRPGTLVQLSNSHEDVLTIDAATATGSVDFADFVTTPRVRRWQSQGAPRLRDNELANGFVALEDGVQVCFEDGSYRHGDHWLIPARTVTGDVEWPVDEATGDPVAMPRRGIVHRYARLGLLARENGVWSLLRDCRHKFPPLTQSCSCCRLSVGDGVESHGDFDSLGAALAHLPDDGGVICLLPGRHVASEVLTGRRNVTIQGCGAASRLVARADRDSGAVLALFDCTRITLERLWIEEPHGWGVVAQGSAWSSASGLSIRHCRIRAARSAIAVDRYEDVTIQASHCSVFEGQRGEAAVSLRAADVEVSGCRFDVEADTDTDTDGRRAWGGIHIKAGSARVRLSANRIAGGAGHGITLGGRIADLDASDDTVGGVVQPSVPSGPVVFGADLDRDNMVVRIADAGGRPVSGVPMFLRSEHEAEAIVSDNDGLVVPSLPAGHMELAAGAGHSVTGVGVVSADNGRQELLITLEPGAALPGPTRPGLPEILTAPTDDDDEPPPPRDQLGDPADDLLPTTDLLILDNHIEGCGLAGIGVIPAPDIFEAEDLVLHANMTAAAVSNDNLTRVLGELVPTDPALFRAQIRRLTIDRNTIDDVFNDIPAPGLIPDQFGYGGITLGSVANARITDNRITDYGDPGEKAVCGLGVVHAEGLIVRGNEIRNDSVGAGEAPGFRGGVVCRLAMDSMGEGAEAAAVEAPMMIDVSENVIQTGVGRALTIVALGNVRVQDNLLQTNFTGPSVADAAAGNSLILNYGGILELGRLLALGTGESADPATPTPSRPGGLMAGDRILSLSRREARTVSTEFVRLSATAEREPLDLAVAPTFRPRPALAVSPPDTTLTAPAADELELPPALFGSGTHFAGNRTMLGAGNSSAVGHGIYGLGDLVYAENHSTSLQRHGLPVSVALLASSLRAAENRLTEAHSETAYSLVTASFGPNSTVDNHADHCIGAVSQGLGGSTVERRGNQVLDPGCANLDENLTTNIATLVSFTVAASETAAPDASGMAVINDRVVGIIDNGRDSLIEDGLGSINRGLVSMLAARDIESVAVTTRMGEAASVLHPDAVGAAARVGNISALNDARRATHGLVSLGEAEVGTDATVIEGAVRIGDRDAASGLRLELVGADDQPLPLHTETVRGGLFRLTIPADTVAELGLAEREDLRLRVVDDAGNVLHRSSATVPVSTGATVSGNIALTPRDIAATRPVRPVEPDRPARRPTLDDVPGIGPRRLERLRVAGILDIDALVATPDERLRSLLGGGANVEAIKENARRLLR